VTPLTPPPGQQVFTQAFAPDPADFDANGHVNNVVYVRWIQDIATAHWRARMAGREDADGWTWVVLRHEIDYRRALLPGETASARTWVGAHRGPRFIRYVRIDGPDGEVCAQATTEWCLIEAATGRPSRVQDWMVERFS
jgi:acyl-CoA thioester hydrolase